MIYVQNEKSCQQHFGVLFDNTFGVRWDINEGVTGFHLEFGGFKNSV